MSDKLTVVQCRIDNCAIFVNGEFETLAENGNMWPRRALGLAKEYDVSETEAFYVSEKQRVVRDKSLDELREIAGVTE